MSVPALDTRSYDEDMAIAALIVSILAMLVAGGSLVYTRRQAVDTSRLAKIESERHHREREPVLYGWIESMNNGGWYRLWLRLDSKEQLSSLRVEIVEGAGVTFPPSQNGVDPSGKRPLAATWSKLDPVESACWMVELAEERSSQIRLRAETTSDGGEWTVSVPVEVPVDILKTVF